MRIKLPSCFIVPFICVSMYPARAQQNFSTHTFTDHNGYTYETVTNDPVRLRVYTLKNGLRVYLARQTDEPSITYATAVRAGSAYDPSDNTGLAHYLEHLLFNGTDKVGSLDWSKEQPLLKQIEDLYEIYKKEQDPFKKKNLYKKIDSASYNASRYGIKGEYRKLVTGLGGVSINGTTNFEYIIYGCVLPSPSLQKFLQLEKDRFSKPALRAFNTELEIVYEEFNTMQDNDFIQKYFAANKMLFKKHPYGQQIVIGTSEHLKNPSLKAIQDYFNTYYVPGNMAVILVGDLEFDKTIREVDNAFGGFRGKAPHRTVFPKEDPIEKPIEIEVSSPQPPSTFISFRTNGAGSEDEKYVTLINKMLSNPVAGMFNLELTSQQKIKSANSLIIINNDYSMHYLMGNPVEGQSLEEVKEKMLSVLDKIKKGEFDDWLIGACAKDIKRAFLKDITEDKNLDAVSAQAFIHFQSWGNRLAFMNDIEKISKKQLMEFANKTYQNNYVVVYKRQGPSSDLVKVDNPGITPILLNEDKESAWAKNFIKTKPANTPPAFIDFTKAIRHITLVNGLPLAYIPNEKNNLFQLDIIFDMGRNTDKKIQLAMNYINFIGTNIYTASTWKKEFYKLGLSYSFSPQIDRTVIHLEGLPESLESGIRLLNHIFNDLVPDQQLYDKYVQNILNNRKSNRNNRSTIRQAAVNFALYGEESSFRNIYSEAELKKIDPAELTNLLKHLKENKHRFFYYGKDPAGLRTALEKFYEVKQIIKELPMAKNYFIQATKPVVYFADYEGAQAEVVIMTRGEKFDRGSMSLSNMFNRFIEKVDFQGIREARSLAYSAGATHWMSEDTVNYNYMELFAGSQVNKLNELLKVSTGLMNSISGMEALFNEAKADQIKRYQRERVSGTSIFRYYEAFNKQGIHTDFRKDMYQDILKMQFKDMLHFFEKNIAGRDVAIVIVGDKKDMDMKELSKYGEVNELNVDYLFNYK